MNNLQEKIKTSNTEISEPSLNEDELRTIAKLLDALMETDFEQHNTSHPNKSMLGAVK